MFYQREGVIIFNTAKNKIPPPAPPFEEIYKNFFTLKEILEYFTPPSYKISP